MGWGVSVTPRPLFTPEKTRYSLYRMLGGPQGRSGQLRKISPLPGFDPRTVQPVASRFTNCAIPAHPHQPRSQKNLFIGITNNGPPSYANATNKCRMPEPFVDNVVRTSNLANVPCRLSQHLFAHIPCYCDLSTRLLSVYTVLRW